MIEQFKKSFDLSIKDLCKNHIPNFLQQIKILLLEINFIKNLLK